MFIQLSKPFLGRQAGEKIDVSEADARHLIDQQLAVAVTEDPLVPAVARAFENAFSRFNDSLTSALDVSLKSFLAQTGKKGAPFLPPPVGGIDADGADPRWGFKNLSDFALAVKHASFPGNNPDTRLINIAQKAPSGLGEQTGSDGGFLIPPEFSSKILERMYADSALLQRTDQYTITGNSLVFPRNNETSRATGSRWGGVRAYWLEEGNQVTNSKPGFGRLTLNLHKLAVLIYCTDELLQDSGGMALEQYLLRVGSEEINFLVSDAILNGTGSGQPQGILNANCLVAVTKENGQAASTIVHENIVKMWSRLWAPCRQNAVWLINQDVEPQLHTMTLNVGTGGLPTYLPPGGLSDKPYATLLGRPVLPVEQCSTLGTQGDIILADLEHYVTISKGIIESAMSMHLRFDYDELAFRLIFRCDGQPWWATALTPYKGTNTQSCFIALGTRS